MVCTSCNIRDAKIGDVCRECWRHGAGYHPEKPVIQIKHYEKRTHKAHAVKTQHPQHDMHVVTPISNAVEHDETWTAPVPLDHGEVLPGVQAETVHPVLEALLRQQVAKRESGELAKPKSSGCWFCLETEDYGPLCGVCETLMADFKTWLAAASS